MNTNLINNDCNIILDKLKNYWHNLNGKKLFITGGTGFFGTWFLESFCWVNNKLDLKAKAVILTRNSKAFIQKAPHLAFDPSITLINGDVVNFDFIHDNYYGIIHLATEASASLNENEPLKMLETIIRGTQRVLDYAIYTKTKKLLMTSSGAVYGKQPSQIETISEEYCGCPDCMNPVSIYGEGKRVAELLCATYNQKYGVETTIARCFAFVGPYLPLDIHFAIGNFINDGLHGQSIKIKGDGTPIRSYMYAADLIIWLWTIFFKGLPCHPYNVGSEIGFSIAEIAKFVSQCFENKIEIEIKKKSSSTSIVERYVPSTKRAQKELDLTLITDVKNAIEKTIHWNTLISKK